MTLRPLADIRADLEKLDDDLDNYNEKGILISEIQARRDILAAELQAWFESFHD